MAETLNTQPIMIEVAKGGTPDSGLPVAGQSQVSPLTLPPNPGNRRQETRVWVFGCLGVVYARVVG